jgi:hypothetical protein
MQTDRRPAPCGGRSARAGQPPGPTRTRYLVQCTVDVDEALEGRRPAGPAVQEATEEHRRQAGRKDGRNLAQRVS